MSVGTATSFFGAGSRSANRLAKIAASGAALVAALGLTGVAFDIPRLSRMVGNGAIMRPLTAMTIVVGAAGIWLALDSRRASQRAARVMAAALLALSAASLLTQPNAFPGLGSTAGPLLDGWGTGRMSGNAAISVGMLALALLTVRAANEWPSQVLAGLAGFASLVAMVTHIYDVTSLSALGTYGAVAFNSALGFGLLALGILCAREGDGVVALVCRDSIGGQLARRIVPAAFVGPLVLGWIRLEGERAGLYSTAFGVALFAITNVVFFVVLTTATAAYLDRTDIQRQAAERDLAALNTELEARVDARTTALEASNRELEAFSYSVSHDLRAPLRTVAGFSQILLNEHASELTPEASRYLRRVAAGAKQMGQLVDDLLSLSRLGRVPMTRVPVNPEEVARETLVDLEPEMDGREMTIAIDPLPACAADRGLLKQVYANLLANAVKFTRHQPHARIDVGSRTDDEGACVYFVRDNGVGFDMKYADKLFGVFQRLHRAEDYEGTGVGLAITQRIIARHNGRIWAEAAPEHGACFLFTIGGSA